MLSVLIVDDDSRKVQLLKGALASIRDLDIPSVSTESTILGAKTRLEETKYDLMILDMALPNRLGQEVMRDGGLQLLDEVLERDRFKMPSHVIGVTSYPEIFADAQQNLSRRLITILLFEPNSDSWI